MGFGTILALALVAVMAVGSGVQVRRAGREIDGLAASIARLGLLRRTLDTLNADAAAIRSAADTTTTDVFAQRGHR